MPNESEPINSSTEFDSSAWPEIIGCKVMPTSETEATEVEVVDAENYPSIFYVYPEAVRKTNIPVVLGKAKEWGVPKEAQNILEEAVGLGLLSCRVIEIFSSAGLIKIELPTIDGPTRLTIQESSLGRRK